LHDAHFNTKLNLHYCGWMICFKVKNSQFVWA